jgi:hypothetical protein
MHLTIEQLEEFWQLQTMLQRRMAAALKYCCAERYSWELDPDKDELILHNVVDDDTAEVFVPSESDGQTMLNYEIPLAPLLMDDNDFVKWEKDQQKRIEAEREQSKKEYADKARQDELRRLAELQRKYPQAAKKYLNGQYE